MINLDFLEEAPAGGPSRARRSAGKRLLAMAGVAALLLAASVVLVIALTGSSGQRGEARNIMEKSDEKLDALRPNGERINSSVNIMLPDIGYLKSAQYEVTKGNIHGLIEETTARLEEVREGYGGILNLEGVEEYVEYAKVKIALIDVDREQLAVVDGYLDYLGKALADRDAGVPIDARAVTDATSSSVSRLKELSVKVEELTARAERVKKERTL